MYQFFNIGEIADFFQISRSKLRYWDNEGLISLARNTNNDYREFSIRAITDVANIMFYRSLNIPIKELKKLSEMDMLDLDAILNKTEKNIVSQINAMQQTLGRLQQKRLQIERVKAYFLTPFVHDEFNFNQVVALQRSNRQHLQLCIENSENFAVVVNPGQDYNYVSGVVINQLDANDEVLWHKTTTKCLKCLLKFDYGRPTLDIRNTLKDLEVYLQDHNLKSGVIIARFLLNELGAAPVNYHEAYVELL